MTYVKCEYNDACQKEGEYIVYIKFAPNGKMCMCPEHARQVMP